MSHGRIDELYERRMQLHLNLKTCEGMGWRDDERYDQISAELLVIGIEIEKLENRNR